MNIKIERLSEHVSLPEYQTKHSAAMDLHAAIDKPLPIKPFQRLAVPCGFKLEIPVGYEVQIRARSGLSFKHGLTTVNGVGTIDADYRGEIAVLLVNLSDQTYEIEPNERIAQMLLAKCERIELTESNKLSNTKRGTGGFGSTGK